MCSTPFLIKLSAVAFETTHHHRLKSHLPKTEPVHIHNLANAHRKISASRQISISFSIAEDIILQQTISRTTAICEEIKSTDD